MSFISKFDFNFFLKLLLMDISFQLSLLVLLILILHFFYKNITIKQENGDALLFSYKIYHFRFNNFLIFIYLVINIYLLFYLRLQYFNKPIDLKIPIQFYFKIIKVLPFLNSVLITAIFVCLWLVILFLFTKFHLFFLKEIKKRYLFLSSMSSLHIYLLRQDIKSYSLDNVYDFIVKKALPLFIYLTAPNSPISSKKGDFLWRQFHNILTYIFFKFYSHFMISYFFYELIYNEGILSTRFNKLLFVYILYKIYIRCCNIGKEQCLRLNPYIFDMYYRSYSLKYVNLPEEWQNHIYEYIRNDLYENNESYPIEDAKLMRKHIFTTHDGVEYFNFENTTFTEENNESKDIVAGDQNFYDKAHVLRQMYPKEVKSDPL